MGTVSEKAYAKINLFLDVSARRADGFHDIKTVMHSVSLADEVELEIEALDDRQVELITDSEDIPTDASNLAVRAALSYLEKSGVSARVRINLKKNIPVAAGLAGGSSDAAATLRAMNSILGKFSDTELLSLAASLGSDVPYCLVGGTALCEGRGEIITPISGVKPLYLVIAIGDARVSTPRAYGRLDEIFSDFDGSRPTGGDRYFDALISAIGSGKIDNLVLFNVFEEAVIPTAPEISSIKSKLLKYGALGALMSGSGPSVFGIFDTENDAKSACDSLKSSGFSAFYAESV